jgi:hypothetical protein
LGCRAHGTVVAMARLISVVMGAGSPPSVLSCRGVSGTDVQEPGMEEPSYS